MRNLNIGVAGLGNWGKNVVRCLSRAKHATLSAICDSDPQRLNAQLALYPSTRGYLSFDELLADDTIDAIALVTPAPAHFAMGKRIL